MFAKPLRSCASAGGTRRGSGAPTCNVHEPLAGRAAAGGGSSARVGAALVAAPHPRPSGAREAATTAAWRQRERFDPGTTRPYPRSRAPRPGILRAVGQRFTSEHLTGIWSTEPFAPGASNFAVRISAAMQSAASFATSPRWRTLDEDTSPFAATSPDADADADADAGAAALVGVERADDRDAPPRPSAKAPGRGFSRAVPRVR